MTGPRPAVSAGPPERADAWLAAVQRLAELRDKPERNAADEVELRTLWARYTPQMPPKMPSTLAAALERLTAIKERLDDPTTSDTVFNRLSWNFADMVDHTMSQVEAGEWIGDQRLAGVLNAPPDSERRRDAWH